jgi:hypothetical protein
MTTTTFKITDEAREEQWWNLNKYWYKYSSPEEIDWNKVWDDVQADPYPPQGTDLESILFVFEQLTRFLPLEEIVNAFLNEKYHFRYCQDILLQRFPSLPFLNFCD